MMSSQIPTLARGGKGGGGESGSQLIKCIKGHGHDTDEWRDYDVDNVLFKARKGVCSR